MGIAARIAKNTAFLGLAQVANKIITFVFMLFAMRFLGAAGFGKYSLIFTVFYLLNVLADMGLGPLSVREVSKNKRLADKYLTNVIAVRLLLTTLVAVGAFLVIPRLDLPADTAAALRIVLSSLVLYSAAYAFGDMFTAHERMGYVALVLVALNLATSSAGVVALVLGYRLVTLALIWLAGSVLQLALAAGLLFRVLFRPRIRFDPAFARGMLTQAWPFLLSNVVLMVFWRADILILAWVRGDVAVGWYSGAYRFLDAILFIPQSFLSAAYPVMSQLYGEEGDAFANLCRRAARYLLIVALPVAAGTTILAGQILPALIRNVQFERSVPALQILIWTFVTLSLRSVFINALNAAGRQRTNFLVDGIAMVANIALNLALIPSLGYLGAAAVTVATDFLALGLVYWFFRRLVGGLGLVPTVWRVVLATAIMAAAVWPARGLPVGLPVLIGAAVYSAAAAALRAVSADDLELIRQILGRPQAPVALEQVEVQAVEPR